MSDQITAVPFALPALITVRSVRCRSYADEDLGSSRRIAAIAGSAPCAGTICGDVRPQPGMRSGGDG